ncbi:DUF551 domain-containing protein [Faecalicoccus pleomorphus]|uniref:DUF551 domain-containing protein n=1 Tax=Faecalicoccus pleomorphus TaxID=1323 RepID=UPI003DA4E68A
MIDEKKLIEELRKYADELGTVRGEIELANGVLKAISIINEQPKVGEWIPVEERLPKNGGAYLITAINDCGGVYMDVSYYDSQYKSFSSDGVDDDNAIAWMDLPKMYEVRENE